MSVDGMRPGSFEERLLGELRLVVTERRSDVEQRPSGRPGGFAARRRPWRIAVAAGVGLAVVLVGMTGLLRDWGDGAPAAYAVTRNPNGTVTVEVRSLRDAAGLQRALRAAGVRAVVVYTPPGTTCRRGWFTPAGTHPGIAAGSSVRRMSQSARFTIERRIPPGDTLVIATTGSRQSDGVSFGSLEVAVARGTVGSCRLVPSRGAVPTGVSAP